MRTFGLFGFPLSHSFSPDWFAEYFTQNKVKDAQYKLFPIEEVSEIIQLINKDSTLLGLNVTIPHKQHIIPLLNELSADAQEIGAVNCIKINRENKQVYTVGHNTDVIGFYKSIQPLLQNVHTKALVFGNGGSSKAVQVALRKLGIEYKVVSRNITSNAIGYQQLDFDILSSHTIWINTTPLGMFPNTDVCLDIDFNALSKNHLVYDLVYNPIETLFLQKCKSKGAQTKNGIEMLQIQAMASAEIWGV